MWLPVLDLTARGVMTDGWRLVPTLVVPCLSPSSHLHVPAGDLRELPRVRLIGEGSCGGGVMLSNCFTLDLLGQ